MEGGRDQWAGHLDTLDTLVVASVVGAHLEGKLDSPEELLGELDREWEERQD